MSNPFLSTPFCKFRQSHSPLCFFLHRQELIFKKSRINSGFIIPLKKAKGEEMDAACQSLRTVTP